MGIIKNFNDFVDEIYESVSPDIDIEDVLAKKLGIDKLFKYTKNEDGSYVSQPIDKPYPKSKVFSSMIDNGWNFVDLFKNDDLNYGRARKCYFEKLNPKDIFSKYISNNVSKSLNDLKSQIDTLPDVVKDILDSSAIWVIVSPDNGVCMICRRVNYRYVSTIYFTGLRSYSTLTSKTKDTIRKKRVGEITKKRKETIAISKAKEEAKRKEKERIESERLRAEEETKKENERIRLEREKEFKKNNPKFSEILKYIYDKYFEKKYWHPTLDVDTILYEDGKYHFNKTAIKVKDEKLYIATSYMDIIEIQNIMKDVSAEFGVTEYYNYEVDWNFKGSSRYGTEPITDFDEYEEEWSEPDRFYTSHRTLKRKE